MVSTCPCVCIPPTGQDSGRACIRCSRSCLQLPSFRQPQPLCSLLPSLFFSLRSPTSHSLAPKLSRCTPILTAISYFLFTNSSLHLGTSPHSTALCSLQHYNIPPTPRSPTPPSPPLPVQQVMYRRTSFIPQHLSLSFPCQSVLQCSCTSSTNRDNKERYILCRACVFGAQPFSVIKGL